MRAPLRQRPHRAWPAVLATTALLLLAGCGGSPAPAPTDPAASSEPSPLPDAEAPAGSGGTATAEQTPQDTRTPEATPTPPSEDEEAGLLSREVPQVGTGELSVVPGVASAPGEGREWTIRVAVEGGLDVDGAAFADFVMRTLNDPRGWTNEGYTFSRTDSDDFDTQVVLASPDTSEEMCRPLGTMGTLSCRKGDQAVLTLFRWVNGTEDYGDDLTGYRQYLVQHEVGHALGHGHVGCPGKGEPAPLMMQQTKGLDGCATNPWPYP